MGFVDFVLPIYPSEYSRRLSSGGLYARSDSMRRKSQVWIKPINGRAILLQSNENFKKGLI